MKKRAILIILILPAVLGTFLLTGCDLLLMGSEKVQERIVLFETDLNMYSGNSSRGQLWLDRINDNFTAALVKHGTSENKMSLGWWNANFNAAKTYAFDDVSVFLDQVTARLYTGSSSYFVTMTVDTTDSLRRISSLVITGYPSFGEDLVLQVP